MEPDFGKVVFFVDYIAGGNIEEWTGLEVAIKADKAGIDAAPAAFGYFESFFGAGLANNSGKRRSTRNSYINRGT